MLADNRRSQKVTEGELTALLASGRRSIDFRSPTEFAQGSIPGACNLPILNDEERHLVGKTHKQDGADAARALGHQLVSGSTRESRVAAWIDFLQQHEDAYVYCWRGGERSAIASQWLAEAGLHPARIAGGYKALRRELLQVLTLTQFDTSGWLVLGGRTGSGKTTLLHELPAAVDLEGLAQHRGSAFGATTTEQPSPATFENQLATTLLTQKSRHIVFEDESRTIGRLAVPDALYAVMQSAPVVLLIEDLEARVTNIVREYIDLALLTRTAAQLHAQYQGALDRIQRRLGGQRHKEVSALLAQGFAENRHQPWVERMLVWYYDPMYDYQLSRKRDRVSFTGNRQAVFEYVSGLAANGL